MTPHPSRTNSSGSPIKVEVSPVHGPTSRRLLGLAAECGLLLDCTTRMTRRDADALNMTAMCSPFQYVVQQQRSPNIFSGAPY